VENSPARFTDVLGLKTCKKSGLYSGVQTSGTGTRQDRRLWLWEFVDNPSISMPLGITVQLWGPWETVEVRDIPTAGGPDLGMELPPQCDWDGDVIFGSSRTVKYLSGNFFWGTTREIVEIKETPWSRSYTCKFEVPDGCPCPKEWN
jgi:hypothetical protein